MWRRKKISDVVPVSGKTIASIAAVASLILLVFWFEEIFSFIYFCVSALAGNSPISLLISLFVSLLLFLCIPAWTAVFVGYLVIGVGVLSFVVLLVIYAVNEDVEISFMIPVYITVAGFVLLACGCFMRKYSDD